MVVTPGADPNAIPHGFKDETTKDGDDEEMVLDTELGRSLGATTSQSESTFASNVMAWEDPFKEAQNVSLCIFMFDFLWLYNFLFF